MENNFKKLSKKVLAILDKSRKVSRQSSADRDKNKKI
jgi:hypothetical protein